MSLLFDVTEKKKIRVIIDTDAACEADDPFAIVHGLISPKLVVKGIIAEHFCQENSMERSYAEIQTILSCMNLSVPVFKGQDGPMEKDKSISEGVKFIYEEAMKEDDKPLYILCQGAITNVAVAIREYPEIIDRMKIIWIGTHGLITKDVPFREFNSGNDVSAANFVLQSGIEIWIVPSSVYTTINIGIAEIQKRIMPCGKIGKHLFDNLVQYNMSEEASWTKGESWSLGDSPAIALALNPDCGRYQYINTPIINEDTSSLIPEQSERKVRLYTDIDARYILEDFIAKLELSYKIE